MNTLHLTVDEYEQMIERGAFDRLREKHIELIQGELRAEGEPLYLTIDEYERMIDSGAFDNLQNKHVELIRGRLLEMSPQGAPHHRITVALSYWSYDHTDRQVVEVSTQCPIRIPGVHSEPEPDIVWTKPVLQQNRHPEPHEVFLAIEVAVTSLALDLGAKALLYAQAGIADYWVVDVPGRMIHVLRQPSPTGYLEQQQVGADGEVRPLHFPEIVLRAAELFAR